MIEPGQQLDLQIEKPAAGGRMIARHDGQVVLALGAIPGERVRAVVERVEKRLAFAAVEAVLEASPDRREPPADPSCGGCSYNHIAYSRQVRLKAEIVADAFARLARLPLPAPLTIAGSPERGYRMRARFHVRAGRAGFFREGTHTLCDAGSTGQLHSDAVPAVQSIVQQLTAAGVTPLDIEMTDTLAGDQRAVHVTTSGPAPPSSALVSMLGTTMTAVSVTGNDGRRSVAGPARIAETLASLTAGRAAGTLLRSAQSFFQANRFLLPSLVTAVLDTTPAEGEVLDLYAGVGLFAMSLAGAGRDGVSAVEGAGASGADLEANAAGMDGRVRAEVSSVERYLARRQSLPPTVIVDPPRTGLSREVGQRFCAAPPSRLIYVSCDPATLARDSRLLVDAGMQLRGLHGFDLFPNTPHVETLAIFDRR